MNTANDPSESGEDDTAEELQAEGEAESDPELDIAVGDDWSKDQLLLLVLRQLFQAVEAHIADGELVPSQELEFAMMNARHQLDWS